MARINKSRFAILGCLSLKPMSAYDIKEFIKKTTSHFWSEREGQIYPTLKLLKNEKLVIFSEQESEKGGLKKIYSLTDQGKIGLANWLNQKADQPIYRNELILKLFFGANQSYDKNIKLIESAREDIIETLTFLTGIKNHKMPNYPDNPHKCYMTITLEYGIDVLKAEQSWCNKMIERINEIKRNN